MTIIEVKPKLKFKRIMLATDFSPIAEVAQVYAVGMALEDSANLRLTTVLDLSKVVPYMEVIPESALDDLGIQPKTPSGTPPVASTGLASRQWCSKDSRRPRSSSTKPSTPQSI